MTGAKLARSATAKGGPRIGSARLIIAIGLWVALAPLVFGGDEAADWGWNPLVLSLPAAAAAVVGGAGMLSNRPGVARPGALLALGGGIWLVLGAVFGAPLWAGAGTQAGLGDSVRVLVWAAFFFQAGALMAAISSYALGFLDLVARSPAPVGPTPEGQLFCESRRRRRSVAWPPSPREPLHPVGRRRSRGDGSIR